MKGRKIFGFLDFVNEKVFRKSKQSSADLGSTVNILVAKVIHFLRSKREIELKLEYPNNVFLVPLPNRYSCPKDRNTSTQKLFMTLKQAALEGP